MMLTELCQELKNYFLAHREEDVHEGTYTISSGSIGPLAFLQAGQYYRIVGSVFNDGVHKYGDTEEALTDEVFDGAVWAMAVPPAVVALADEIEAWMAANAETIASPFMSESFGGYSYSKGASTNGTSVAGWETQFASRLARWRKISPL